MSEQSATALSVLIANHNTAPFVELSLRALHALTRSRFQVLIHDDGSKPPDVEALRGLESRYRDVRIFHREPSARGGSFAHGEALDFLFAQVDTPYTAIFDADCAPLMAGWDEYLIDQIDDTTKIVGSTLGEGWAGHKPIDFPLPFMALFETETYRRLGISALPEDPAEGRDSCWQWRPKFVEGGYQGRTLRSVNTRYTPEGPFRSVNCAVYYTDDGRIVGSHFGRGSNPGGKRSRWPRPIDTALRRIAGGSMVAREIRREQERWRGICLEIIEQQATARLAPIR